MEKIKLDLDNSKKYVVACSFGPDSMALLSAAIEEKLNVVVAHVNYRKREAAIKEQKNLTKFCQERNIKLFVLDLLNRKPTGNFQEWARKVRYEFFKDVLENECADSVLIAHNEDDVIETYIMQKRRGNIVKNYGISKENEVFGVKILRPLLNYSKQYLQDYDDEKHIPYSIDESNLRDDYTRNKIRHSIVQKMSVIERQNTINEIINLKQPSVEFKTEYKKQEFLNLTYPQIVILLDDYMQKVCEHRNLSEKFVEQIKNTFNSKTTHRYRITESVWLELDYDSVYILNGSLFGSYAVSIKDEFKNDWIDLDFSLGAADRGLSSLPTEFIIKNCDKKDRLIIKDYTSEVRRLFIDWKMPLFLREMWPGLYDENGKLLYVPRYRKNYKDEHKSKFKIDTKYFLKF